MENQLHIHNGYSDELFPVNICEVQKNSILPEGSGFKSLHWHEDLQFVLCVKGFVYYQVNGIQYLIHENEALFINKGALHLSNDMSDDGVYITITFPEELLYFFKESRMKYKFVWPYTRMDSLRVYEIKHQEKIIRLLKKIVNAYKENISFKEYEISISIARIWRELLDCFDQIEFVSNPKDIEKQERVQVMLVFIHMNYSENISLEDISKAGMMSVAQCNRYFNQMLNVTPYEYLIQYRLSKAVDLLRDTTLNVTEISEKVGFNSVTHFIQVFKKKHKVSPKQYRMHC